MFLGKSHYQTLQISPQSSVKDIKKAFKSQIRKHHPDKHIWTQGELDFLSDSSKNGKQEKKQISMKIIEAYQCLIDLQRRKVYDRELRIQSLKYHMKQTRHKDTVSLSGQYQQKAHNNQSLNQESVKQVVSKSSSSETTTKSNEQENTQQEQDHYTILVCQQCFGQNQVDNKQLQQINKVQLSVNCQYCGLYITIVE